MLLIEEERMRRIGALVCRIAMQLPEPPEPRRPMPVIIPGPLANEAVPEELVLAYLRGVREASPVEIRLTLGLSRSMAFRTLQRLVLAGQAATSGSTKAVVYRAVTSDPSRN